MTASIDRSSTAGPAVDTFSRSCQHWSAAGQAGMDAFYRLAVADYRHLAAAHDWPAVFAALHRRGAPPRLADLACGSGKFPAALVAHTALGQSEQSIDYDLLDPSRFSIETARQELLAPFVPGREYECTAQAWPVEPQAYGMIWATHALYCVPAGELAAVAANIATGLASGGVGLVAQSTRAGHYVCFYDRFCQALAPERTPYSDIEQVAAALQDAGLATHLSMLEYDTSIAKDDPRLLERYLQRCAFDDDVSLAAMRAASPLAEYLGACETAHGVAFRQQVGVLVFAHDLDDLRAVGLLDHEKDTSHV